MKDTQGGKRSTQLEYGVSVEVIKGERSKITKNHMNMICVVKGWQ